MPKKSSPALSEEYLKALYEGLKALTPLLDTSLTELEREIGLPSKTLTIGLKPDSNRNFTKKHYDILLKYAEDNWDAELFAIFTKPFQKLLEIESVVEEEPLLEQEAICSMELSEEELDNKNFWIEEIKRIKNGN